MEEVYQLIFPSKLGRAAKPFRLLYGAQLIKQKYGWSDGCRGAYSANHIFAAFCMHINPKEKYKNRSFACKLFNDKENKTGETPYMNARFAIFCVRGMSQILKPFVEQ